MPAKLGEFAGRIAAIERPSGGAVLVNGQNVGALKRAALPYLRRNLGLVFQDQKLLFDRNAFENVMLPLSITGFPPREAAQRVRAALDKVGLLKREKANPISLSAEFRAFIDGLIRDAQQETQAHP